MFKTDVTPDSKTIASVGGNDRTIKLWDVASRELRRSFAASPTLITTLALSPDGRWLAAAYEDHIIKLWDAESGAERFTLTGHTAPVFSMVFHPTRPILATGDIQHGGLKMWDVTTGRLSADLPAYTMTVSGLEFSPDGRALAAGVFDGLDATIKLWSMEQQRFTMVLRGFEMPVTGAAFSRDGRRLATCSGDAVRLWDLATGQEAARFPSPESQVTSVAFGQEDRLLVGGRLDGSVLLWRAAREADVPRMK